MSNRIKISDEELAKSEAILGKASVEIKIAMAVKLVREFSLVWDKALAVVNLEKTRAWRHWDRTFAEKPSEAIGKGHGGRRREHLPEEAERSFLIQWHEDAIAGKVVTIANMKEDYEVKSGKPMSDVGFYKLMRRHRWRKLKPDSKHPKSDFQKQEGFKKKSVPSSSRKGKKYRCRAGAWFPPDVPR